MMDHFGIVKAPTGVGPEGVSGRARRASTPIVSSPRTRSTRTRAWTRSGPRRTRCKEHGAKAAHCWGTGLIPQVPLNDKKMYPALREVRGARHPDLRVRRRARAPHPLRAPVRRPARRGVLVLPRAEDHHAPRWRTVDRADGEAAAEVAEPLLLDQRVRAEALQQGHHPLREHARRRQGHLRRVLPDGPHRSTASSPSCRKFRSAITCGRSSSTRTRRAC